MDNIIDEKKNLNKKIIMYSIIFTLIIFMLIGNLNLITMLCRDTSNLRKIDILKKGFSMSIIDVGILYVALGIFVNIILKDKKSILKNYIKVKVKNNSILNKDIKFLNTVLFIALSINLCIKFILYFVFKNTLVSSFNIRFDSLLLSLFYSVLVISILYLLVIINYVSIKDFISGTFAYCMIFSVLSIVLGVSSLFISKSISWIQDILILVYNVYNLVITPFYAFYNVYNESLSTNVSVILILGIIILGLVCIFKNSLNSLNKDNIKRFYINSVFRKIFYMAIAVASSYIIFLVGFLALISFNFLTYDAGILSIDLLQVVFAIVIHLNKQVLKINSKVKKKNSESDLEKRVIFKSLNLENELEDCKKIKDFSFNKLDKCLLNKDDLGDNLNIGAILDNEDNDLENEIIINKETEKSKDDENLIDFLNKNNTIKN